MVCGALIELRVYIQKEFGAEQSRYGNPENGHRSDSVKRLLTTFGKTKIGVI
jgi:hypothetical protein